MKNMGLKVTELGAFPNAGDIGTNYPTLTQAQQEQVIQHLKGGNPVIIYVIKKLGSIYTSSQHYMALLDVSSDGSKVRVSDPADPAETHNGWNSTTDVFKGAIGAKLVSK